MTIVITIAIIVVGIIFAAVTWYGARSMILPAKNVMCNNNYY